MSMKEKIPGFDKELKRQVKREQSYRCLVCGSKDSLSCHHIVPKSLGRQYGMTMRELNGKHNCAALCDLCHKVADEYALNKGVFLPKLMEQGIDYFLDLRRSFSLSNMSK